MNNKNLINPLSPRQYESFNFWFYSSVVLVILLLSGLIFYTTMVYHSLYRLKKELQVLHSPALQEMNQKKIELIKKIEQVKHCNQKITHWTHRLEYHNHLTALATTIPEQVALTTITFENDDVELEGKTEKIESVLPFMNDLEKSKFYKELTLMHITTSHDSQNLVNFLLKGKLL